MIYFLVFFQSILTLFLIKYVFELKTKIANLQKNIQEHLDTHELRNYNLTEHYSLGK